MNGAGFRSVVVVVAALLFGGAAAPLRAQTPADTLARILAVVGNTPILDTELDEELFARRQQGRQIPDDPAALRAFRAQVLQEMIDNEVIFLRAQADTTIKITEEEVTSAVDQIFRNVRQRFPNDAAFRAEIRTTGFQTPDEYRRWLAERQRKQLMVSRLIETYKAKGTIKPVVPTDRELRAFWDTQKSQYSRPETLTFRQLVIAPRASAGARQAALTLADSILVELRKGADFATAARRFSQDPGSREQGGSLGWFRRGVMDPGFEEVAFRLRAGVVSDPVETPYGIHLIQVERIQPAEVLARHILIVPEITLADADTARALAERIHAAVQAGASFDSAQRIHHDPLELREIRDLQVTELLDAYKEPLQELPEGRVSSVFALPVPQAPLRTKFALVRMEERRAAGEFRFEDVRDPLRTQLGDQMAIRRFIDGLRAAVYLEVRGP